VAKTTGARLGEGDCTSDEEQQPIPIKFITEIIGFPKGFHWDSQKFFFQILWYRYRCGIGGPIIANYSLGLFLGKEKGERRKEKKNTIPLSGECCEFE
jgi:hypothetical protein